MKNILEEPGAAIQLPAARAVDYFRNLKDYEIADVASALFPANAYQRILFHCYVKTVVHCENPIINPRYFVVNLLGAAGFGKSGSVYSFGRVLQKYLQEELGIPVEFKVITRTFAGINDFADILGIVNPDKETGTTKLYPPENFPKVGDNTLGFIFIDDFNRGHPHVIAAGMEFVNTGRYNDYKLPLGWSTVAASNPQGQKNRVVSLDEAQFTRFVPLVYQPAREVFIEQLVEQGVAGELLAYATKYREKAAIPDMAGVLPEPRPLNWRNFTIFAHLYPSLKYDDLAKEIVAHAIFGPGALRDLEAILQGEMPLSPEEILGVKDEEQKLNPELLSPVDAWPKAEEKIKQFIAEHRTDLLAVSSHRLVIALNNPKFFLSEEQTDALCEFILILPKQIAVDFMRRLLGRGQPRRDYFLNVITFWRSEDGRKAGPAGQRFFEVNSQMVEKIRRIEAEREKKTT